MGSILGRIAWGFLGAGWAGLWSHWFGSLSELACVGLFAASLLLMVAATASLAFRVVPRER